MKKEYFILIFQLLLVLLFIQSILAIDIDVSSEPVQTSVISDVKEPAIFNLTIYNMGNTDDFEIYSLVGIDIYPRTVSLSSGETKTITIKIMPQESLLNNNGQYNFIYKIKNSNNEIVEDSLSINIVDLESSFNLDPGDIDLKSDEVVINLKNNINYQFADLQLKFNSVFFDYENVVSLNPKDTLSIKIPLKKQEMKTLNAGKYLMNSELVFRGKKIYQESKINFLEQENIETNEDKEGFFIQKIEITKKNIGNVEKLASVTIEKNIFSYLFTSVSKAPDEKYFNNFKRVYEWNEQLLPNEELEITTTTNWFYPIIIIIFAFFGVMLVRKSVYTDLILRKKVSFVKTKGGEFALKVSVILKSKKYVQKIKIIDKLPHLVELYEKYGAITPDHVDVKTRKLEWNVDSLNKGDTRVFTYIIYSKIGIVGRFELPSARVVYEKDGKIKEATSNRSFYVNEPKKDGKK